MKLKGVELTGFKSFADKTKLSFEDGITAIVGPNGSGKSNVSDAVKWVFGEQSVKSLRGAKMEDVIFGGTQGRKQQGFAMVSLAIDNTDRAIAIDNDEVIITRKLYRSGESEYKLNENAVRLRDIHQMFMDTGLGRDGYSIIEQGKIAEIISVKSQQRREIFEEAAGISKYRYRKGEAEKSLVRTEENLIRLRDILLGLEERVEPLRIQSEKAKKFVVFMEERKSLELGIWVDRLEKLKEQLRELEDKILVSRGERNEIVRELEEIEQKLEQCTLQQQQYVIYIDNKRKEIRELEETVSNAKVNHAVMQNDIGHNEQSIAELENRLQQSGQSAAKIDSETAEIRDNISVLQQKKETLAYSVTKSRENMAAMRVQQAETEDSIRRINLQRDQISESKSSALVSKESSATLIEETISRLEALKTGSTEEENYTSLQEEYRHTQEFIEKLTDDAQSLMNSKNGYEYKLRGKQQTLDELDNKYRTLESDIGKKLQKAQLLADMEKNMEGFAGSVKFVMKRSEQGALSGIHGTLSTLINVDERYTIAMEIALGAALQNIVVEDDQTAKRAINMLKDANAGRATFLPVQSIKSGQNIQENYNNLDGYIAVAADLVSVESKYTQIINRLLGRVIIAEDMDSAVVIGKKCGNRYRIVTLDGQVINTGGSLTGGSSGKSGALLSRKNQIDELQAQAKELSVSLEEIGSQTENLTSECNTIRATVAGIDAEMRTCKEDTLVAENEKKRLSMAIEDAGERKNRIALEIETLTKRVEELKGQSISSAQLADALENDLTKLASELTALTAKREDIIAKIDVLSGEISAMEIALAEGSKDYAQATTQLENLELDRTNHAEFVRQINEQKQELMDKNADIAAKMAAVTELTENSGAAIAEMQTAIATKQNESRELEQETTQLRKREKEASSQRENISLEYGRLEERQKSLISENDNIVSQMWEEYELSRTEAAEIAIKIEDFAAANRRLAELKSRIKSMGTVNVAAIEEYDHVSEQYEFLKSQIADVENAKSELIKMITQLSSEMSSIFLEKFAEISYHFSDIFRELFGGGKGQITLTEPENPLETGIDIFVQPPGKIIKNLTALSGGEQAFVAICIYFAILKVSPAPFVLLDEIEAALDDVNVNRFAMYLRKMARNTQFIAITHRRGTMEEADVLYGVTMEEEGVSKLLKLNVSELEEKLDLNL